jgi:simple sugar transport system permease protein
MSVTPTAKRDRIELIALYVVTIILAFVIAAILVNTSGGSWSKAVEAMINGSFKNPGRWGETLRRAAPLLIVAAGSAIAAKAGIINIGQEGQVLIGATGAAFIMTKIHPGSPLMLILGVVLGMLAGAAWAGISALLYYWRRVPVVLSTLLLVYLSSQITGYTMTRKFLLLEVVEGSPNRIQNSAKTAVSSRLGIMHIFGNNVPLTVPIAIIFAIGVAYMLAHSVWGFRLKMLGLNPRTAQRAGVSHVKFGTMALLTSGAAAGLAGSLMLATGESNYRASSGFSASVGWDGLLVALVARNNPYASIPVALAFACLHTGSNFLAAAGVESVLVDVIRGLLVLALFIPPAVSELRKKRRVLALMTERA